MNRVKFGVETRWIGLMAVAVMHTSSKKAKASIICGGSRPNSKQKTQTMFASCRTTSKRRAGKQEEIKEPFENPVAKQELSFSSHSSFSLSSSSSRSLSTEFNSFAIKFAQTKTLRGRTELLEDSVDVTTNNNCALRLLQAVLGFCLSQGSGLELLSYQWVTKLLQVKLPQVQRIQKANVYQMFLFVLRGLETTELAGPAEELNAKLMPWTDRALRSHSLSARDNLYLTSMRVLNQAYEHQHSDNEHVAKISQAWITMLMGTNDDDTL
ncbi:hypothetical protein BASA82_000491 [Batrachochytrium salamandrivorans]|nr:hypothetical protein BASA82_000491 [Batrachochytrium salamandrivorans]